MQQNSIRYQELPWTTMASLSAKPFINTTVFEFVFVTIEG